MSVPLTVRVSGRLLAHVRREAELLDMPVAEYVRETLLARVVYDLALRQGRATLPTLVRELRVACDEGGDIEGALEAFIGAVESAVADRP